MTLRSNLISFATDNLDAIEGAARSALLDADRSVLRNVKNDVKALRLALQQWEALVRALQTDRRSQAYAIPDVLGEEAREQHEKVRTLVSRLEAIHGLTEATAQ